MCPAATGATLFAVGVMLCPFPALVPPSCRNLTAVLPELWGLLAAVYFHIRDELEQLLLPPPPPPRRRSPRYDD